jgi:hypothetical protein
MWAPGGVHQVSCGGSSRISHHNNIRVVLFSAAQSAQGRRRPKTPPTLIKWKMTQEPNHPVPRPPPARNPPQQHGMQSAKSIPGEHCMVSQQHQAGEISLTSPGVLANCSSSWEKECWQGRHWSWALGQRVDPSCPGWLPPCSHLHSHTRHLTPYTSSLSCPLRFLHHPYINLKIFL